MSVGRLRRFYDREDSAAGVPRVIEIPEGNQPSDRVEIAAELAMTDAGGRYLEVGAGDGSLALTLLDMYECLVLTEVSRARAQRLRGLFERQPKVTVHVNDIETERLPFYSDGWFDTACMTAVIEHLIDPVETLRELYRLLKPGGRLIITTPNIAKWTRRVKLLLGRFPSTASVDEGLVRYDKSTRTKLYDHGHLHYFTFRSLSRVCVERTGFSRTERYGYGNWRSLKTVAFLARAWPTLFSDVCLVAYK